MLLTENQTKMINEAIEHLTILEGILDNEDINDPEVQPRFQEQLRKYSAMVEKVECSGGFAAEALNERLGE